jgi:hypothetical protein
MYKKAMVCMEEFSFAIRCLGMDTSNYVPYSPSSYKIRKF